MECPKCGTLNPDTARFCRNCGQALVEAAPSAPPPAAPVVPIETYRPAEGSLGGIRIIGFMAIALSLLILLGFFVMPWVGGRLSQEIGISGGYLSLTGWNIFYFMLSNLGDAFRALGLVIQVSFWFFLVMLCFILLFLIPLGAIIIGIRGILFVVSPAGASGVRGKVTRWSLTAALLLIIMILSMVLFAVQFGAGSQINLGGLQYGFWITLASSIVLYVLGLVLVPRLVPYAQR